MRSDVDLELARHSCVENPEGKTRREKHIYATTCQFTAQDYKYRERLHLSWSTVCTTEDPKDWSMIILLF